jgi:hypothetical protein
MNHIKVEFDISQVLALGRGLSEAAMVRTWRRTLRKVANWIKSRAAREVSRETKIAQKVIRQRLYFFLRSKAEGKVWLGMNPLEAARLGKPRQTRTGVTVGKFRFDRAWIYRSSHTGERTIDIRHSNGRVETKTYQGAADRNNGRVYRRVGKARTPYELVMYEWSEMAEKAFRAAAAEAGERLRTVLKQEINYEIQKALGNAR